MNQARALTSTNLGAWWVIFLRRNLSGLIGLALLTFCVVAAVIGPKVYTVDPIAIDLPDRLMPPVFAGGSPAHLLGTDQLGRDMLSRILHGARVSLLVGFTATLISVILGVVLGLGSGYYGGLLDDVIMRIGDAQLAIPFLVLIITVVAVLGPGVLNIILTLGIAGWIQFARVIRAETLSLRDREFVLAARVSGSTDRTILFRHILPNTAASIIVLATFQFALVIIVEASLSFLGLGVPPPTPSWGAMISSGRAYMQVAWWLTAIPGLAIVFVVLGANILGDWLRDRLDPYASRLPAE
jgi:peptide/nickel transport system permease protein